MGIFFKFKNCVNSVGRAYGCAYGCAGRGVRLRGCRRTVVGCKRTVALLRAYGCVLHSVECAIVQCMHGMLKGYFEFSGLIT